MVSVFPSRSVLKIPLHDVKPFHLREERQDTRNMPSRIIRHGCNHQFWAMGQSSGGSKDSAGAPIEKLHLSLVQFLELFCAVNELVNMWNVEAQGERHVEAVEQGGINSGDEILQVLASTMEYKVGESGEDGACQWRGIYMEGSILTESKSNGKGFEVGQSGQESGHRVR
jgi:hypothetical protein